MKYKSKIDWWIGLILLGIPVVEMGMIVQGFVLEPNPGIGWGGVISLAVTILLYGGAIFPLEYSLEEDGVLVRQGLIRRTIPYGDIKAVRPTMNPISSPALSLKRIHLDHGRSWQTYISPAEREKFFDELAGKLPHLERDGETFTAKEEDGE